MAQVAGGGGGIPFCMPDTPPEHLGGGAFRIEPDKIPDLLAGLQAALDKLGTINQVASDAVGLEPPGIDPYSADAMVNFSKTMQGGENAFIGAHQKYVLSIKKTMENLQKLQQSTQSQEGSNTTALGGSGS